MKHLGCWHGNGRNIISVSAQGGRMINCPVYLFGIAIVWLAVELLRDFEEGGVVHECL